MAKNKDSTHDNFFLTQFSRLDFALSFFQEYLPNEIKPLIDWSSLQLAPGDFVQKALRRRKSDLLYEVRIAKKKVFLYLHLEHQRKPVAKMSYRMLIYQSHIWQQYEKQHPDTPPPLIFPMVLYQGKSKWSAPLSFQDYLNVPNELKPFVPDFQYVLIDLSHLSDEDIKGEVYVRLVLLVMKHIDSPELIEFLFNTLLPLVVKIEQQETGLEVLETILYYIGQAGAHLNKEEVIQRFEQLPNTSKPEKFMATLAEQWRQEGRQEGLEKGELIGEIRLTQKLLKLPQSSKKELFEKTTEELDELLSPLEQQLSL